MRGGLIIRGRRCAAAMIAERPEAISLSLAGQRLLLTGAGWQRALPDGYAPFRSVLPEKAFHLHLEQLSGQAQPWPAETLPAPGRGDVLELRWQDLCATIDLAAGQGTVWAPRANAAPVAFLWALLRELLEDGLIVHGALLSDGDRGWLCAGPSGCGKTTLAGLFPEHRLADELTALRRIEGEWHAFSLPAGQSRPGSRPLAGIRLLRHGREHRRRPLAAREATTRLGAEILWPFIRAGTMASRIPLLLDLLAEMPVDELSFRPDRGVWPVLTGRVESA